MSAPFEPVRCGTYGCSREHRLSDPGESVTVPGLMGDSLTVEVHTVSSEHDGPLVFVSGEPNNPFGPLSAAYEPQAACNLAVDILIAAEVAGSPVAKYILGRFQIAVTQDGDYDVLDEDNADGAQ